MAAYGRFLPKNPQKYVGDAENIFFRSSWEITVMKWLDSRKAVLRWGSEEITIPYLGPDGKVHNYFPDFFVEYEKDGRVLKEILEVKPRHESDEKYAKHDRSKAALEVNERKWKAAARFCEERGWTFRVLTEDSLFHNPKRKRVSKVVNGEA